MKKATAFLAMAAAGMLLLSGCAGGAEAAPTAVPGGTAKAATCDAVKVGDVITRCENFYKDYWPEINKQLDELYKKAKATDNGRLVIWDWYEQSPEVVAAFNKRFPDIKVESRGLTYNLSSAIISAKATGARNTDIVSGSIVTTAPMYDQGFWEKVDWTTFGVPKEYLTVGAPEMMADSINGSLMQYNSDKITPPASLDGLLDPQFAGKTSIAGYNPVVFEAYGMAKGKEAMVDLIGKLKSSGSLKLVEDQDTPLSSGDIPIALNQTLFNPNPALKVQPFEHSGVWAQFSGVNSAAANKPAAMLWILWNAFDPDWIKERMTNPDFATTQVPYAGLPSSVFDEATGLMKKNADALLDGLKNGAGTETQATREKWIAMVDAADKALNG